MSDDSPAEALAEEGPATIVAATDLDDVEEPSDEELKKTEGET